MLSKESKTDLVERAEAEEKACNWFKAAILDEKIAKSYLENNMNNEAAEFYKKSGYNYLESGNTVETAQDYRERHKSATQAFNEAAILFKQTGNKAKKLESEAGENLAKSFIANSVLEAKEFFNKCYELAIESSVLYSKLNDRESVARVLIGATQALIYILFYCDDPKEFEQKILRKTNEKTVDCGSQQV